MNIEDGKHSVGIDSEIMNHFVHTQLRDQLCWAASIQTVLKYYGIIVSQQDIVLRTFPRLPNGFLPNRPANSQTIHNHLNNWEYIVGGVTFVVKAEFGEGAPPPRLLITELHAERPIIAAYHTGPNTGHAVVVTAIDFTALNNEVTVRKIVVRDPSADEANKQRLGRIEYGGRDFASEMVGYWIVRVQRKC